MARDRRDEVLSQVAALVVLIEDRLGDIKRADELARLDARLVAIDAKLDALATYLHERVPTIMAALDNLTAAVAAETTVNQSAITLLGELKTSLDAAIAAGDMAGVQAIADQIGANSDALAAAVTQNTPAAAVEPPVEPPVS